MGPIRCVGARRVCVCVCVCVCANRSNNVPCPLMQPLLSESSQLALAVSSLSSVCLQYRLGGGGVRGPLQGSLISMSCVFPGTAAGPVADRTGSLRV